MNAQHTRPAPLAAPFPIAVSWEGRDHTLLEMVLPFIDCLEVNTDAMYWVEDGVVALHPTFEDVRRSAESVDIVFHGVGLSIASHEGMHQPYLDLLDLIFAAFTPTFHSEHLGYARVDGKSLGTMLTPPRTREMVEILVPRINQIQERYNAPFALEHVVRILPDAPADYSEAEFLNELVRRTGCKLIIDPYNLQCDAQNYKLDIDDFLNTLNLDAVIEMHMARGKPYRGMLLDAHSLPVAPDTLELAQTIAVRCPNLQLVTYEILPQAVQVIGHQAVVDEVKRLRTYFGSPQWTSQNTSAHSTA